MINQVLQCCYTNASHEAGSALSSGWQAVAVSPGLPSDVYKFCTRLQNANSSIQRAMVDEKGNVLNLLEYSGDGSYIYVLRTQYGLLDRLGRANMFSHAYIIPCRDAGTVSDPNVFLTIANENFKSSEEEAMAEQAELIRLPAFNIQSAMKKCGIGPSELRVLVKSVYAQAADKKVTKPLYIQYDGEEDTLKAILYCVYYALPFSLRRKLSVASVQTDNTVGMNIIFSRKATSQELYVNPSAGESSILTARTDRRISRLGFLDFALDNIENPHVQSYYEKLEKKAIELGDPTAANELILKIAHTHLTEKNLAAVNDEELDTRLSDALRSKSVGNAVMDNYIALLLGEITTRKLVLTDENEESLTYRLNESESAVLSKAAEQYNFYRFNELTIPEAAAKLSKMSTAVFNNYRGKLAKSEHGQKILDHYYGEVLLEENGNTWEGLDLIVSQVADLRLIPNTNDKIEQKAWNLYCDSFSKIKTGNIQHVVSEYRNYMSLMQKRVNRMNLSTCENAAKEAFWDQVTYANIDFDKLPSYKELRTEDASCRKKLIYCSLPTLLQQQGEIDYFRSGNNLFTRMERMDDSAQIADAIDKVVGEAKHWKENLVENFELWSKLLFTTSDQAMFNALIKLFQAVKGNRFSDIKSAFKNFVSLRDEDNMPASTGNLIAKIMLPIYHSYDSEEKPIPLDDWLRLGGYLYENSFQILEEIQPEILYVNEEDVVSESSFLRKRKYFTDAENYVKNRGAEAKAVKKWLSVLQRIKKAEDKKKSGGQGFGLFKTVFSSVTNMAEDESTSARKQRPVERSKYARDISDRKTNIAHSESSDKKKDDDKKDKKIFFGL